MKIGNIIAVLVAIFALSSFFQGKGVKMISTTKNFSSESSTVTKTILYLDENKLKIDISNSYKNNSLIFNSKEEKLWLINHRHKQFMMLSKDELRNISNNEPASNAELISLRKNAIHSLLNLSQPYANLNSFPSYYIRKNEKNNINGWECTKYEGYHNKYLTQELWTTSLKDLNLTDSDAKTLRSFSRFIQHVPLELLVEFETFVLPNQEHEGIAVNCRSLKNGQLVSVRNLEKVEKTNLSTSIFEVPDYQPVEITHAKKN
jgi:hypothetical protein